MKLTKKQKIQVMTISFLPWLLLLLLWPWWQLAALQLMMMFGLAIFFQWTNHQGFTLQLHYRRQAFMNAYALIKVLIIQGRTIYQSIQSVIPYSPAWLGQLFHHWLIAMDQDQTIHPYINLAKEFQSIMIEQLLFALYQLENQGGQTHHLQAFQYVFNQAELQHYQTQVSMVHDRMQNANGQVMIATGLIAFSLLVGVMNLIAGMMYGI